MFISRILEEDPISDIEYPDGDAVYEIPKPNRPIVGWAMCVYGHNKTKEEGFMRVNKSIRLHCGALYIC